MRPHRPVSNSKGRRTLDGFVRELLGDLALQTRVRRLGVHDQPLQVHAQRLGERIICWFHTIPLDSKRVT